MQNFEFLQKYQQLQLGIAFDEIINLDFTTISINKTNTSIYWNLALIDKLLSTDELNKLEKQFKKLKRKSTVYFENNNSNQKLKQFLSKKGYKNTFEDSWMFYEKPDLDRRHFNNVIKVLNQKQLQSFQKTFNSCYQKNDPQNPYGELGDAYLKGSEKAWNKHHNTDQVEYFYVLKNNQPVSISSLTNIKGIGYISNVGSLRSVRGEGYGKTASLYAVMQSRKRKNEVHVLATEEGTYPNKFYKRIGFKTLFTTVGFTKEI